MDKLSSAVFENFLALNLEINIAHLGVVVVRFERDLAIFADLFLNLDTILWKFGTILLVFVGVLLEGGVLFSVDGCCEN